MREHATITQPQMNQMQLFNTELEQIRLYIGAYLFGACMRLPALLFTASHANFGGNEQLRRVGRKGLANEYIGHPGPVIASGIDNFNSELHGTPENRKCFCSVRGWSPRFRSCQAHRSEPHAGDIGPDSDCDGTD